MSQIEDALDTAGFKAFAEAIRESPYGEVLDSGGAYTMFAPTDEAFGKFSASSLERLLRGDEALMRSVLGYHFAAGKVRVARFQGSRIRAVMYAGGDVIIYGKSGGVRVHKANLSQPDIVAGNCIVHGIDAVLWPQESAQRAS